MQAVADKSENGSEPKEVDCNDPGGFDGAVLNNCEDPFFSVEFVIDGEVYVLEKEDLMVHLETIFGTVCILRVVASQGMDVSTIRTQIERSAVVVVSSGEAE